MFTFWDDWGDDLLDLVQFALVWFGLLTKKSRLVTLAGRANSFTIRLMNNEQTFL